MIMSLLRSTPTNARTTIVQRRWKHQLMVTVPNPARNPGCDEFVDDYLCDQFGDAAPQIVAVSDVIRPKQQMQENRNDSAKATVPENKQQQNPGTNSANGKQNTSTLAVPVPVPKSSIARRASLTRPTSAEIRSYVESENTQRTEKVARPATSDSGLSTPSNLELRATTGASPSEDLEFELQRTKAENVRLKEMNGTLRGLVKKMHEEGSRLKKKLLRWQAWYEQFQGVAHLFGTKSSETK